MRGQLASLVFENQTQTVVLTGPGGSGKYSWALALAAAWLCESPSVNGACGVCPSCRYFSAETHPDYIELLPEAEAKTIPIDEIRSRIHAEIATSPQIGQRRVWVLDGDQIQEASQNSLLKVLEEPPDYARFILTVTDQTKLLPTLISRATVISIPRLKDEELDLVLTAGGVEDVETRALAITFAKGLPGLALELAQNETYPEIRRSTLAWLSALPDHDLDVLLTDDFRYFDENRGEIDTVLMFLQSFVRDLAILNADVEHKNLMHKDLVQELKQLARRLPLTAEKASNIIRILNDTEYRLHGNANFEMAICRMLILLREEIVNVRNL